MLRPSNNLLEVFVCVKPIDFRKRIPGLSVWIESQPGNNSFSEHRYVFCNRRRNKVKIDNLYTAIEKGLALDEATNRRLHMLKGEREKFLIDLSTLHSKRHNPLGKTNKSRTEQFCQALRTRLMESELGFG